MSNHSWLKKGQKSKQLNLISDREKNQFPKLWRQEFHSFTPLSPTVQACVDCWLKAQTHWTSLILLWHNGISMTRKQEPWEAQPSCFSPTQVLLDHILQGSKDLAKDLQCLLQPCISVQKNTSLNKINVQKQRKLCAVWPRGSPSRLSPWLRHLIILLSAESLAEPTMFLWVTHCQAPGIWFLQEPYEAVTTTTSF